MRLDKVVAGVDGSVHGRAAVEWAAGISGLTGAEVIAVHAVGLLEELTPAFTTTDHRSLAEMRERLEHEWLDDLPDTSARVRFVLRESNPVLALLAVVEEEGADLLVVGTRGTGGRPDALLGSTSAAVIERAPCPVVVIPPGLSPG